MKTILIGLIALTLTGCATLHNVGMEICERADTTRAALEIALNRAYDIPNVERREAAILAITASLSALDQC